MKFILLVSLLASAISGFSQFRTTKWEMNMQEVKDLESTQLLHEGKDYLSYKIFVEEFDCKHNYIFAKNKLIEATYLFTSLIRDNFYREESCCLE